MRKYIVAYDLRKQGQNYTGLIQALKEFPSVHPMQSTWFIKTNLTASEIRGHLKQFIDQNDSIFVGEISSSWAAQMSQEALDFLK